MNEFEKWKEENGDRVKASMKKMIDGLIDEGQAFTMGIEVASLLESAFMGGVQAACARINDDGKSDG